MSPNSQAPWQNKGKQNETATVAAAGDEDDEMFAFTCTSDYTDVAALAILVLVLTAEQVTTTHLIEQNSEITKKLIEI